MIEVSNAININFDQIAENAFWNIGDNCEYKMHRIHAYPAKFPAFITTKALEFARTRGLEVECVADVFCGCGTVAYEARRNNIEFWGCDINPVATMIATVKSQCYDSNILESLYCNIIKEYKEISEVNLDVYDTANERLQYWYSKEQYEELTKLKQSIDKINYEEGKYKLFYLCAFSNILKGTSKWLTKSIKPQLDLKKISNNVIKAFEAQCKFMISANGENEFFINSKSTIVNANLLDSSLKKPKVDMIITSPPYVTSYEYADLHQLSTIWLEYSDDYRALRNGTIGSLYHTYNFSKELKRLNKTGSKIVFQLLDKDKSKAKAVAKYFLDMQKVSDTTYNMLRDKGMAFFVIGDTEYKNVRIENARHLIESLFESGFRNIEVTKRKISRKILTPYRDEKGKFTTDKNSRKIYSEEFIVIGRK